MTKTPDRTPGPSVEEEIQFEDRSSDGDPTVTGAVRFVDDDLVLKKAAAVVSLSAGFSEAQHQALRQLIHFIEDGPGSGFASGAYCEVTGGIFPTEVIWWETAGKAKRIVKKVIDRTSAGASLVSPTPIDWLIYDTDGSTVLAAIRDTITYSSPGVVASKTRTMYSGAPPVVRPLVNEYEHGATGLNAYAYAGAAYDPVNKRIYFAPHGQASSSTWHYYDCVAEEIVGYAHGAGYVVGNAYIGAVYEPINQRIYFIPYNIANQTDWQYVDCAGGGTIVEYAHGSSAVRYGYCGGVYDPINERIYMTPLDQSDESTWHYIRMSDGAVVGYAHGVTAVNNAYIGGAYDPINERIYFAPRSQSTQSTWHYVRLSDGAVVGYTHGASGVASNAYAGAAYDPVNDYIWLCPYEQSNQSTWHYIDLSDGSVNGYVHGKSGIVSRAYNSPIYEGENDRIFLTPFEQIAESKWHYIDCTAKTLEEYDNPTDAGDLTDDDAYTGAAYDEENKLIFWSPRKQAAESIWHFIAAETVA